MRRWAVISVVVLVGTACTATGDDEPTAGQTTGVVASAPDGGSSVAATRAGTPDAPPPTATPTPTTSTNPAPDPGPTGTPTWVEVAAGFDAPVATLVDPRTGDLLVVEQPGTIRELDGTVVLDITDRVTSGGERGLLDATTSVDGTRLFVHYSGDDGATTLSSLPVQSTEDGELADAGAETVLLRLDQPAGNHNGGSVVVGPDGWLYLALGDGGGGNDRYGNGANLDTPLGAILRLDVDSDPSTAAPAPGNPYVDGGGDARVWVAGVRNPWRITHDGQQWFVADVGQDAQEEVTVVPADTGPHDLGWPSWEGTTCRLDPCAPDTIAPVHVLGHDDGACSILGGAVAQVPTMDDGDYFFTDLCDTQVRRLDPASGDVVVDSQLPGAALALDVDVDGSVVALIQDGRVLVRTRG